MIPLAHYYVIAGKVYQAPDIGNVVNSRLANCANYLQQAFAETHSYAKYQSAKGYYWEFRDKESQALEAAKEEKLKGESLKRKTKKKKEEPSSLFQRQKVDRLLDDLMKKFPLKMMNPPTTNAEGNAVTNTDKPTSDSAVNGSVVENGVVAGTESSFSPPTSVSIGSGAKRVAHADAKGKIESPGGGDVKPPLEKKIKLEKK